ncbi:hypothetical protein N1I86_04265 [Bacillus sp. FSL W8-0116]|uniref:hypothetical protein n=1 Tax=Bacillus sp. FSL W8-0116 TaxID=2978206 RepID=UPI0030F57C18
MADLSITFAKVISLTDPIVSGKTEQFLYAYYLLFFALLGILQHDWYKKRLQKKRRLQDPEVLRTTKIVDGRRNHEGVIMK